MNLMMMLATTRRVLDQLRHDHRSIALILVVPALLLTPCTFFMRMKRCRQACPGLLTALA